MSEAKFQTEVGDLGPVTSKEGISLKDAARAVLLEEQELTSLLKQQMSGSKPDEFGIV
ncbi:MAG: hypothetical protein AAF244_00090 [Pseudomonadota bacterium]